jgi:hypothetical protein
MLRQQVSALVGIAVILVLGACGDTRGESRGTDSGTIPTTGGTMVLSTAEIGGLSMDSSPSLPAGSSESPNETDPPSPSLIRRFAITSDNDHVVWAVRERLVEQCMAQRGYEYVESPYPEDGNVTALSILYPDPALVEAHGYLWRAAVTPPIPPSPENQYQSDPPALDALGSCGDSALATLDQGAVSEIMNTISAADTETQVAATTDRRFLDAMTVWGDCMSARGFAF